MFTGIVQTIGSIGRIDAHGDDRRIAVQADAGFLSGIRSGESICVNGVCLTVAGSEGGMFEADVSAETLSCTTLGLLAGGAPVNLEKSLRAADRLGGHFVLGHVDGIGRIRSRREDARSVRFEVEAPGSLSRYLCRKGSVCVDGVSLTINSISGAVFDVNIIPHTMTETIFGNYGIDTPVNLEVDVIARYLERLLGESGKGKGKRVKGKG
jgi:riboflavin synthase